MIAEFHELLPVCEVRAQPAGSTAVNAKLAFETADEDIMVDGIKGCRKVKANQQSNLLLVGIRIHTVHESMRTTEHQE